MTPGKRKGYLFSSSLFQFSFYLREARQVRPGPRAAKFTLYDTERRTFLDGK
jgi:hypothetical protein